MYGVTTCLPITIKLKSPGHYYPNFPVLLTLIIAIIPFTLLWMIRRKCKRSMPGLLVYYSLLELAVIAIIKPGT